MGNDYFISLRLFMEMGVPLLLGVIVPLAILVMLRKKTPIAVNNLRVGPWMIAAAWFFAIFFDLINFRAYHPWTLFAPYSLKALQTSADLVALLIVPGVAFAVAGVRLHRRFRDRARGEILGSLSFLLLCLSGLGLMLIPMDWMYYGAYVRGDREYMAYYGLTGSFGHDCLSPAIGVVGIAAIALLPGIGLMLLTVFARPKSRTN